MWTSRSFVVLALAVLAAVHQLAAPVLAQRQCPNGGLLCPSGQVCCPGVDGVQFCAANVAGCPCNYAGNCPTRSCCTQEFTGTQGQCTSQPVLADGTQVCANCRNFNGLTCPATKSICCTDGTCASSTEACSCGYSAYCPSGYCCTSESYQPGSGHCTNQPFLPDGTQACPNCNSFNGASCPNDQVCCPNGSCASDLEACGCTYQGQCPSGYCCTTQTGEPGGHCTSQAVLADGTQVCPNCNYFNGLTCPDDQLCCPGSGQCAATPEGCTCSYYSSECPLYSCCTRTQADGTPGRCTEQVIQPGGIQACPNCHDFNGLGCPENGLCCISGSTYGKCAKRASLCNSATGGYDPHFELMGLAESNEKFTFDFHGEPNKTYCMISDATLQINVHMFGLTKSTKVLKERIEEVESFFEGTWMDGLGFLYLDHTGEQQNITINFDAALDRQGKPPFNISFNGENIGFDGITPWWSNPDGIARINGLKNRNNALAIYIDDLLELELEGDFEKELIADPPVHFINFKINKLATGPDVHGFLGQMYAPGAIEERLSMGTLEGLLHREYVEGTDPEYETTSLTDSNCSFKRFGQALKEVVDGPYAIGDNSMPLSIVSVPRRLLAIHRVENPMEVCHPKVSSTEGKDFSIDCE